MDGFHFVSIVYSASGDNFEQPLCGLEFWLFMQIHLGEELLVSVMILHLASWGIARLSLKVPVLSYIPTSVRVLISPHLQYLLLSVLLMMATSVNVKLCFIEILVCTPLMGNVEQVFLCLFTKCLSSSDQCPAKYYCNIIITHVFDIYILSLYKYLIKLLAHFCLGFILLSYVAALYILDK